MKKKRQRRENSCGTIEDIAQRCKPTDNINKKTSGANKNTNENYKKKKRQIDEKRPAV